MEESEKGIGVYTDIRMFLVVVFSAIILSAIFWNYL